MEPETSRLTTLRAIWATLDDEAASQPLPDELAIGAAIARLLVESGEPVERFQFCRIILHRLSPHYWRDWLLRTRVAVQYGVAIGGDPTTLDRRPLASEHSTDAQFRRDFNEVITTREHLRQTVGRTPPRPPYADYPLMHHN